jgi:glutamine synthetase type III
MEALKTQLQQADASHSGGSIHAHTAAFASKVLPAQQALREVLDALEESCNARLWPLPKYREMLAPLS